MDDTKSFSTANDVVTLPHLDHDNPRPSNDTANDVDYLMEHLNDPNFDLRTRPPTLRSNNDKKHPYSHYSASDIDAESHYGSEGRSPSRAESRSSAAIDFDDESPYPEVRAAVASVDDPSMPVNTFRTWFLGILFTLLVSGLNQVFAFRCTYSRSHSSFQIF
jgi:hypothetical protein